MGCRWSRVQISPPRPILRRPNRPPKLLAGDLLERFRDDFFQGARIERLGDEAVASRFEGAVLVVAVAPGEGNDVGLFESRRLLDVLRQFYAVVIRQADVQENDFRPVASGELERRGAG